MPVVIFALMFAVSFVIVTAFQLALAALTLVFRASMALGRLVARLATPPTRLPR